MIFTDFFCSVASTIEEVPECLEVEFLLRTELENYLVSEYYLIAVS